jgi:hypothetical protein
VTRTVIGIIACIFLAAVGFLATATAMPGVRASGAPARQADGPCVEDTGRYIDCMNGTVTDTMTGLIWLQQADCLTGATPADAAAAVAALADGQCDLTDGSSPGDWRLPTKVEWAATLAPAVSLGCRFAIAGGLPSLTNETGTSCFQELEERLGDGRVSLYSGVASAIYLSSTGDKNDPGVTWIAFLGEGDSNFIGSFGQGFPLRVWPVRGGPW